MTQFESAIIRQPFDEPSYIEANVWGMVFYAVGLYEEEYPHELKGVHLYEFVGHLLLFLQHANDLFEQTGLAGTILIETSLQSIRDRKWFHAQQIIPGTAPVGVVRPESGLDDEFSLSVSTTVENLRENPESVAMELLRSIFFSLDWSGLVANETQLGKLIHDGHGFNGNF